MGGPNFALIIPTSRASTSSSPPRTEAGAMPISFMSTGTLFATTFILMGWVEHKRCVPPPLPATPLLSPSHTHHRLRPPALASESLRPLVPPTPSLYDIKSPGSQGAKGSFLGLESMLGVRSEVPHPLPQGGAAC